MATQQSESRNVIISNVVLFWPKLVKPVSPFGTEQWELQIRVPAKRKAELEEFGKVKKQDDGTYSLNLSKKAVKVDGSPAQKIAVVDKQKNEIDPGTIGNGSTGNVMLLLRDWEMKAAKGKPARSGTNVMLTKVQVTNLIEYVPTGGDFTDFEYEESEEEEQEESETVDFDAVEEEPAKPAKKTAAKATTSGGAKPPVKAAPAVKKVGRPTTVGGPKATAAGKF